MSRQWKVLKLYNLENTAGLVWILLPILDGLTIEEQLRKQSINRVQKRNLLCYGAAYVEKDIQEWVVFLSRSNSLDQNIFTLAHELAHTFAWEKRKWRLVNVWKTSDARLEDFCDLFAVEWLQRGDNKEQLTQLLMEHENDEFVYFKQKNSFVFF